MIKTPQSIDECIQQHRNVVPLLVRLCRQYEKSQLHSLVGRIHGTFIVSVLAKCVTFDKIVLPTNGEIEMFQDPQLVYTIAREVYEIVAVFENICVTPKTTDERDLLYWLFHLKGLREAAIRYEEAHLTDSDQYKLMIRDLKDDVALLHSLPAYIRLNADSKKMADKVAIQGRPGCFTIDGDKLTAQPHYSEMMKDAGVAEHFQSQTYSILSLFAHPTSWGFEQFQSIVREDTNNAIPYTCQASMVITQCVCLMIHDLVDLIPEFKEVFDAEPEEKRNFINTCVNELRGRVI